MGFAQPIPSFAVVAIEISVKLIALILAEFANPLLVEFRFGEQGAEYREFCQSDSVTRAVSGLVHRRGSVTIFHSEREAVRQSGAQRSSSCSTSRIPCACSSKS